MRTIFACLSFMLLASCGGENRSADVLTLARSDLITYVTVESPSFGPGRIQTQADCPAGYAALAGGHGFSVSGNNGIDNLGFELWRSIPWRPIGSDQPYSSWQIVGMLKGDFDTWTLWVTATCYKWQPVQVQLPNIQIPEIGFSQ